VTLLLVCESAAHTPRRFPASPSLIMYYFLISLICGFAFRHSA